MTRKEWPRQEVPQRAVHSYYHQEPEPEEQSNHQQPLHHRILQDIRRGCHFGAVMWIMPWEPQSVFHLSAIICINTCSRPVLGAIAPFRESEVDTLLTLLLKCLEVLAHAVIRGNAIPIHARKVRHTKTRIELVGSFGLLPSRPVVGLEQHDAELPLLFLQLLDHGDRVLGRAD